MICDDDRGQVGVAIVAALIVVGLIAGFYYFLYSPSSERGSDLDDTETYWWLDGRLQVDEPISGLTGNMDLGELNVVNIDKAKPSEKSLFGVIGTADGRLKIWSTSSLDETSWSAKGSIPQPGNDKVIDYTETEYHVGRLSSSTSADFEDLALGPIDRDKVYVHVKIITSEGNDDAYHIYEINIPQAYVVEDHIQRE